ncbi:Rv1733c family protein [Streptomyces aurantiogriseus]|uniref:Integral membrane protein n=1 Tax=Streptomyces aurantiogriseus TaxID=66870 RepID=A0A918FFG6_9ACTN|nr:hypothetical protein [Streptomyces aurantiogriseus]GGR34780.1 hypothetical protein GCM10010251_58730 [Streptomyces aurantiogriseus]
MSGGERTNPKLRTKQRLWRWRSNALRRRDDVIEAWIVLAVVTVMTLGGVVVGAVTAHTADNVFARQQAEKHSIRAVLVDYVPLTVSRAVTSDQVRAKVRWTTADGSTRTGTTRVDAGYKAGSDVVVWTDGQGDLTSRPASSGEATARAALIGTTAALAFGGMTFGAGAIARWRLDRRRIEQWGREWDLVGPRWGHKTG